MEDQEAFPEDSLQPQVFQVDADLSPLQVVMEWAAEGNPPAQRVAYILSIPAAAAESSLNEAREVLLPLLTQLAFDDHPDIKQAMAEVLGPLGPLLASKDAKGVAEAGGSSDAMDLLVLAHRLLQDPERGVQEAAAASVAMFAGLLTDENRDEHLAAVVDALMHNYEDEQMQECAADLLTQMVATMGSEHPGWCEEVALPRLLKLAMHRDYNIRVHTVAGLVQLAGCLPAAERTREELLGAFADLCTDHVWSVRQECAGELAEMAQHLPRGAVREQLLPLWVRLSGDVSAWVQAAARRQAGPLLAAIHPEDCSEELLSAFVDAAAGPATLTEACARFLPAVLCNLGPQQWPRLRAAAAALADCEYVSVRVVLAESMHQLVALLGPDEVVADLLPIIQKLSGDEQRVVADALAAHITALLAALPLPTRLPQLAFLARMHPEDGRSCGQWRMRLLVAEQLSGIAALLEQQGLVEVLLPATLRLCEDPVAAVRQAAAAQLGCMVGTLLPQAAAEEAGRGDGGGGDGGGGDSEGGGWGEQGGREQEQGRPGPGPGEPAQQQEQEEQAWQQGAAAAAGAAAAVAAAVADEEMQRQQAGVSLPALAGHAPESGQQPEAQQQPQQQQRDQWQQEGEPASVSRQQLQQPPAPQQQQQPATAAAAAAMPGRPAADAAAAVQQIVRHLVELQRSGCHRARQTYLTFCSALLLPQPGQPQAAAAGAGAGAAAGAPPDAMAAEPAAAQPAADGSGGAVPTPRAPAEPAAGAGSAAAGPACAPALASPAPQPPAWPALPKAVAGSSIVEGLLAGVLALAADPVPNVRLGVARLLAALRQQQPQLAASAPEAVAALDRLRGDADRDVAAAAAVATAAVGPAQSALLVPASQ